MTPAHVCRECKYYFVGAVEKTQTIYSALQNEMVTITGKVRKQMCGYAPGGVAINDDAPVCTHHAKIEESA